MPELSSVKARRDDDADDWISLNAAVASLRHSDTVVTLCICDSVFSLNQWQWLCEVMVSLHQLRRLRLDRNGIQDTMALTFFNLVASDAQRTFTNRCVTPLSKLDQISLRGNALTSRCANQLGKFIVSRQQLSVVDLSSNLLGDHGAQILGVVLQSKQSSSTRLQHLVLQQNKLTIRGLSELLHHISGVGSLSTLDVSKNQISHSVPPRRSFPDVIRTSSITSIDMKHCDLGSQLSPEGVHEMFLAIVLGCQTLLSLKLDGAHPILFSETATRVGDVFGELLFQIAEDSSRTGRLPPRSLTSIRTLSLKGCGLSDDGARALSYAMLNRPNELFLSQLREFNIAFNYLSSDGVLDVLEGVAHLHKCSGIACTLFTQMNAHLVTTSDTDFVYESALETLFALPPTAAPNFIFGPCLWDVPEAQLQILSRGFTCREYCEVVKQLPWTIDNKRLSHVQVVEAIGDMSVIQHSADGISPNRQLPSLLRTPQLLSGHRHTTTADVEKSSPSPQHPMPAPVIKPLVSPPRDENETPISHHDALEIVEVREGDDLPVSVDQQENAPASDQHELPNVDRSPIEPAKAAFESPSTAPSNSLVATAAERLAARKAKIQANRERRKQLMGDLPPIDESAAQIVSTNDDLSVASSDVSAVITTAQPVAAKKTWKSKMKKGKADETSTVADSADLVEAGSAVSMVNDVALVVTSVVEGAVATSVVEGAVATSVESEAPSMLDTTGAAVMTAPPSPLALQSVAAVEQFPILKRRIERDPSKLIGRVKTFTMTFTHPVGHVTCRMWHILSNALHPLHQAAMSALEDDIADLIQPPDDDAEHTVESVTIAVSGEAQTIDVTLSTNEKRVTVSQRLHECAMQGTSLIVSQSDESINTTTSLGGEVHKAFPRCSRILSGGFEAELFSGKHQVASSAASVVDMVEEVGQLLRNLPGDELPVIVRGYTSVFEAVHMHHGNEDDLLRGIHGSLTADDSAIELRREASQHRDHDALLTNDAVSGGDGAVVDESVTNIGAPSATPPRSTTPQYDDPLQDTHNSDTSPSPFAGGARSVPRISASLPWALPTQCESFSKPCFASKLRCTSEGALISMSETAIGKLKEWSICLESHVNTVEAPCSNNIPTIFIPADEANGSDVEPPLPEGPASPSRLRADFNEAASVSSGALDHDETAVSFSAMVSRQIDSKHSLSFLRRGSPNDDSAPHSFRNHDRGGHIRDAVEMILSQVDESVANTVPKELLERRIRNMEKLCREVPPEGPVPLSTASRNKVRVCQGYMSSHLVPQRVMDGTIAAKEAQWPVTLSVEWDGLLILKLDIGGSIQTDKRIVFINPISYGVTASVGGPKATQLVITVLDLHALNEVPQSSVSGTSPSSPARALRQEGAHRTYTIELNSSVKVNRAVRLIKERQAKSLDMMLQQRERSTVKT